MNVRILTCTLTFAIVFGLSACVSESNKRSDGPMREELVSLPAPQVLEREAQSVLQQIRPAAKHSIQGTDNMQMPVPLPMPDSTENYKAFSDNPLVQTSAQPVSTFSIDVDTGAYSNVRRFLQAGSLPPVDAVRVEELLNYFDYGYAGPESTDHPFSVLTELGATPWNGNTRLLHVGIQGYELQKQNRPDANLVFLIDVSGSMSSPDKLGLLKSSIKMMVQNLDEQDHVSIVVYAGASGVVLQPTSGADKRKIVAALNQLSAGGSTHGSAGIELAYNMADRHYKEGSINRVILATDGDFNVGMSDIEQLKRLIEQKRKAGVALTTLGFGTGNYNDHLMEQLADVGNGSYAYIDTLSEAQKVLVDELDGTLMTIAKDVKIQIEFNPATVSEYRLIGYVNRKLANEDFNNDKVDAGEIGAGHSVTALYEIALRGQGGARNTPLKYGNKAQIDTSKELAELRLRYKAPDTNTSQLISAVITPAMQTSEHSEHYLFAAAVAAFGQQLRDSKYINEFSLADTRALASRAKGHDPFGYRSEFIQLLRITETLQAGATGMQRNSG